MDAWLAGYWAVGLAVGLYGGWLAACRPDECRMIAFEYDTEAFHHDPLRLADSSTSIPEQWSSCQRGRPAAVPSPTHLYPLGLKPTSL